MADGLLGRLKASVGAGLASRRAKARSGPGARSGGAGRAGRGTAADTGDDTSAGTGGVTVGYAPEHDGDADPGEIVWAWVPYEEDPTQGKDRPVLIVGHDGPQLAGVQLSSRNRIDRADGDDWVPVGTGAWDSQRRPSYADASRLLRFAPADVRREGAALPRETFDLVLARVARIHDWTDQH